MDGRMLRSIICGALAICCAVPGRWLCLPDENNIAKGTAFAASFDIHEQEARRADIRQKKRSLEKTLRETKGKIDKKRQQCEDVNKQITSVQRQIVEIREQIAALDAEIARKNAVIIEKQAEIQENMYILMRRLVAIYKAGEVHVIDLIFSAKTFDDLIDKAEIISKMSEHDNRLINTLQADIELVESEKREIEAQRAEVERQRAGLAVKQANLQNLLAENERLLKSLEGEKNVTEAEIDENDQEYQRIQLKIMNYYAEKERRKNDGVSQVSASNGWLPSGNYTWPVPGYTRLSSQYWEKRGSVYHKGIDIAGPGIYGKSVVAADSGVVFATHSGCCHDYGKLRSCGCGGGYGNYVILMHGNGKTSIYGHLSRVCVHEGQRVARGQKIGEVGTTGYSTGPHLHFQTKYFGKDYNPLSEY